MKKMLIISWITLLTGLVFRLLHWQYGGMIFLLGVLLLFIHSIIYLLKNAKTDLPTSFLHLSYSFLTIYILFRSSYWSCGPRIFGFPLLFIIALVVALTCFILHFKNKKLPQIFFIVYFVFFIALSYTPSHRIYYFCHLNTVLNEWTRNWNYWAWDNYSWFLYISDEYDEALEANQMAQRAAEERLKDTQDKTITREAVHYLELIKQHEQQIRDRNWTIPPP